MNILLLGIGEVGCNIAKHLVSPDNQVTVVDVDEERLTTLSDLLDVRPVCGHASFPEVLEQAGAAEADILIASTNVDEVNMVACEVCHSLFEVDVKVARIKNQSYLSSKYRNTLFQPQNLCVDHIISPELEIARYIAQSLQVPGSSMALDLSDNMKLLGVRCLEASPLANAPLSLIKGLCPQLSLVVVALQRNDQLMIPSGKDLILAQDRVYLITTNDQIDAAMEAFGYVGHQRQRITLSGCGRVGLTLAQEIEQYQPDVQLTIIEKDRARSEAASRQLKQASVIHGDVLDAGILQESGISSCDVFVATTHDDHINVLSSLLAKHGQAKRVISLLEVMRNTQFYTQLGIDSLVNQNAVTVSSVLKAIRQHRLRSLYTIENGVEVVEAYVSDSSQMVGMSVQDIVIAGQVCVAGLQREGDIWLRPKNAIICAKDRLILAAVPSVIPKLERLVSGRFFYS